MKTDFTGAVVAAIIGTVVAYLITSNFILQDAKPVPIQSPESAVTATTEEPNAEIFNFRAINPTVEAYIDCSNYEDISNCPNAPEVITDDDEENDEYIDTGDEEEE